MTMLDDRLADLLAGAAETFEVPASGMDEILARAEGGTTRVGADGDGPAGPEGHAEEAGAPDEIGRRRPAQL